MRLLCLAVFSFLLTLPALPLGRDGHRLVCALAYDLLTPTAKAEVDRLMALDPDYDQFQDSCSWADRVRGTTRPETAPYHYIGLDRDDPIVDSSDCPEEGCVVSAILKDGGILLQPERFSEQERGEALKFLAHWIGDIHQPLHVSIQGDRGGNDLKLLWQGERDSNLHRVWDSELLLDYMAQAYGIWPEQDRWQPLLRELRWDLALDGVEVREQLDPISWAQESHDLARSRDLAYRFANPDIRTQPGTPYYERNVKILLRRIKLAGVRLAGVLNEIFDPVGRG